MIHSRRAKLQIVIATRNPHKFRELTALLVVPGIRWRSLAKFSRVPAIREDGATFEANAGKKARLTARATGCFALADDSGLEVKVLGGAPGIRSARFAGRHGDDRANNIKLLKQLESVPMSRRQAQFRCVLALASPTKILKITEGILRGRIAPAPKGKQGFGYDPIFLVPRLRRTVAQLPSTVKNRMSHRALAVAKMRRWLTGTRALTTKRVE